MQCQGTLSDSFIRLMDKKRPKLVCTIEAKYKMLDGKCYCAVHAGKVLLEQAVNVKLVEKI